MKVISVIGARPQFIKAAVVSRELRKKHTEILVHTGQHFDQRMSRVFFEQLDMPKPNFNLGINGLSHARMTAKMMEELETVFIKEKPECVLVYGDTNSTLAAALTAAKMHIPICHVEAGVRTHSITNPEEINRVCVDHISYLLLASSTESMVELEKENLAARAVFAGDPMYDAFLYYSGRIEERTFQFESIMGESIKLPDSFYYLTCHREENTLNDSNISEILEAMETSDTKTIYPVHPRNRDTVMRLCKQRQYSNIIFINPVGYFESLFLTKHAKMIITDSGGLQREAFFAEKQCITILDFVTWPETMHGHRNQLAKPERNDIISKMRVEQKIDSSYLPFGDGRSAEKIVRAMEEHYGE